ncbi:hypothetical protein [Catellatospora sp. NPDC049609]|uniref:hypothetical protein n=1 Tax=Catellatospora sp. NPDC049609 TaxID=3155505 RepID=UPI00343F74E9
MTSGPVGMLPEEAGYVAKPQNALKTWPTQGETNWASVDPPRVWDMIRHEDDSLGWEQVKGLRSLASLLISQADRLSQRRDALAQLWPAEQSRAATMALRRIDDLIASMRMDGETAIQNALAIDGIMTSTAKAKREVHQIVQAWETTTNEGGPEWWDHEATRLSYLTEQTMVATERAIRDHRSQITMPAEPSSRNVESPPTEPVPGPVPQPTRAKRTIGYSPGTVHSPNPVPPTLPGFPPLITPPPDDSGPVLQSVPPPVPAVPGQPVSMMPIAPGSPYAPYGGAYVLPGPGVGREGYVVALPQPGSNGTPTVASPIRGGSSGMPAMMPMPMGGPAGQARGGGEGYRRSPDTRWDVAHGVSPIIQPTSLPPAADPTPEQVEEDFRAWFTQTAMPWRNEESTEPAPTVTIRRGATEP